MSDGRPTPTERALAAAIYAPIGLGAKVVDDLPVAFTRARQQLVFARFIGKMAVDQGVRELRDRWDDLTSTAPAETAPTDPVDPPADNELDTSLRDVSVGETSLSDMNTASDDAPQADSLALPDYDQLPASHIVGKLAGLTPDELGAVEAYETAHRHRRTVLGKINQLRVN